MAGKLKGFGFNTASWEETLKIKQDFLEYVEQKRIPGEKVAFYLKCAGVKSLRDCTGEQILAIRKYLAEKFGD